MTKEDLAKLNARAEAWIFAALAGMALALAAAAFAVGIWVATHRGDLDGFDASYLLAEWSYEFHAFCAALGAIFALLWLQVGIHRQKAEHPRRGTALTIGTLAVGMWLAWLGQPNTPPMSDLHYWIHVVVGGIGLVVALWLAWRWTPTPEFRFRTMLFAYGSFIILGLATLQGYRLALRPTKAPSEQCSTCHTRAKLTGVHVSHTSPKFPCADCHNGVAGAADKDTAHGTQRVDSRYRLIPKEFIFSACASCHAPNDGHTDERLGQVASATVLYQGQGCGGCHDAGVIAPDWGTVGRMPDLKPVGPNAAKYLDRAHGHPRIAFFMESIAEPDVNLLPEVIQARDERKGPAPARMPQAVLTDEQIDLLAGYVYGLSRAVSGPKPATATSVSAAPDGRKLYEEKGSCSACHKLSGDGGESGPPLDGVAKKGAAWIRHEIVTPNESLTPGYPPIHPDDYAQQLKPEEIDAIVGYLMRAAE